MPGTPRVANRLLRRVRDYAQVKANGHITRTVARDGLALADGRLLVRDWTTLKCVDLKK